MQMLKCSWRLWGLSLFLLCLIASCGAPQGITKDTLIALEKECIEKLKNDPLQVSSDFQFKVVRGEFSLAQFCWCLVKENRPKNECMKEATPLEF